MSRASAYVVTPQGRHLGEMVYEGTSDILLPDVFDDVDDAWAHSRLAGHDEWARHEACDHGGEPAYAYSDYGGGFWWPVTYCPACRVVKGPLDWDQMWELGPEWPKDGRPPIDGTTAAPALPGPEAEEER
jgi:hypothetical protein